MHSRDKRCASKYILWGGGGIGDNSDLKNDFWSILLKSWCRYHILAKKIFPERALKDVVCGLGTQVNCLASVQFSDCCSMKSTKID